MIRKLGAHRLARPVYFVFALFLIGEGIVQAQKSPDCPGPGKALVLQNLARGVIGEIKEPAQLVVRDANQWKALWKRLGLPLNPAPAAPTVDFSTAMVVAVFAGQGRGVLEIEIKRVERRSECLLINVSERRVPDSLPSNQFETFRPFHLVRVPKASERVVFRHSQTKG